MTGRIRLSFHSRVFLTTLALCWILVGTVMFFQYRREKEFKAELLDAELQICNNRIIEGLADGVAIETLVSDSLAPFCPLRVTLIDRDGTVFYDNNSRTPMPTANHNSRPEVIAARAKGVGRAVERYSESDDDIYFYSAKAGDNGLVVRSAALYTHNLREFLRADSSVLWLMALMTMAMSLVAFFATRRISQSIIRLNRFAERAERGESIYDDCAFPNDELGSIAGHIVRLYVQRDREHREALALEQDRTRLKKQLTNNINHELKTPVASMLVSLDLLRDHPELPEARKEEFIRRIHDNALRLSSLLKDVSTITRIEEAPEMIERQPVDMRGLIDAIVADARLRTDVRIDVDIPPLTVSGNRRLLESVFSNLIDNALTYSGCTVITIKADSAGNFTFSDNGAGLPDDVLPHIFERFYRVDSGRSRATGGTGLGLAIVRNAIAFHGGEISVSNDRGLKFTFTLSPEA